MALAILGGWTESFFFFCWLKDHFLTPAVSGWPLLLLVDGHSSHYDPESIKYARSESIILFCLPPHTTHVAQPLDVSIFKSLKSNWCDVTHKFYQKSRGKVITKYNFVQLFSEAWMKATTPENICSGFRKTGIMPFNPNALNSLYMKKNNKGEESEKEKIRMTQKRKQE